ncbi:MAG: hypothetical protein KDC98_11710 [Planctomycetes bacterium]|nr:hypothetical protein [Planctomycetota bacterium]
MPHLPILSGLLLCGALPLGSCTVYMRYRVDEPVPPAALATLRPGQSALGECLEALGAPDRAFEYDCDGVALLWSWLDTHDWSFEVQVPVYDRVSADFQLDLSSDRRQGCLLWFGPDLVLERFRQGRIGELLPGRSRPSAVE